MNKLLPCPFCGGEPEIQQIGTNRVKIICKKCQVNKIAKVKRKSVDWLTGELISWWNQRNNVKSFSLVRLKDHTGVYRAYLLPENHPKGPFLFVCLAADEIRYSADVEVVEVYD